MTSADGGAVVTGSSVPKGSLFALSCSFPTSPTDPVPDCAFAAGPGATVTISNSPVQRLIIKHPIVGFGS